MRYPRLYAILFFPVLFLVLAETCPTEEDGESIESNINFTTNGSNVLGSDTITSDRPENSFQAEVVITSNEAIDNSDVRAFILATCRDGGEQYFAIPLNNSSLVVLAGSGSTQASFCNGPTGQRGRVTWQVVVERLNRFVTFSVRVNASGG